MKADLEHILYKISQCLDYQNLYALEEDFNKIGLSVQTTTKNRMILCRVNEGKIVSDRVIDDYIFIGSLNETTRELSDRMTQKISDFVQNKASKPSKVENKARAWRNGLRMYEHVIIVNEDVKAIADIIQE